VPLDPARVADTATYEEPEQAPQGLPYVLVNGVPVIDKGAFTGQLPDRALRKY